MNKLSSLKIIVMILVLALVLGISTSVYATDGVVVLDDNTSEAGTITDLDGNEANNTIEDVNIVENEVEIDNEVEDIPDTGRNDTMLVVLIGIVAVSAVYTYTKVRKYNV